MALRWTALILIAITTSLAGAYEPGQPESKSSEAMPTELNGVGVTEHLGASIDLGLVFTDEANQPVTLGKYFQSERPVAMAMVYYDCPHLCTYQLNGILDVVKQMKGEAGKDYEFVIVSMDHKETAELAAQKKESYMKALGQPNAASAWHFLVGSEASVRTLADQLGFKFRWDERLKQFAHAAVMYVLTPSGKISRYLHGIEYSPQTFRFSLIEASGGKVGTMIERATLFCFQFDPTKNKYTLYAFNLVRIVAALVVALLALFIVPAWFRERKGRAPGA